MVLSVSVIRVIVWLAGNEGSLLLPSITNILDHISIAQEKIKIQTLKFGFYRILPAFSCLDSSVFFSAEEYFFFFLIKNMENHL